MHSTNATKPNNANAQKTTARIFRTAAHRPIAVLPMQRVEALGAEIASATNHRFRGPDVVVCSFNSFEAALWRELLKRSGSRPGGGTGTGGGDVFTSTSWFKPRLILQMY